MGRTSNLLGVLLEPSEASCRPAEKLWQSSRLVADLLQLLVELGHEPKPATEARREATEALQRIACHDKRGAKPEQPSELLGNVKLPSRTKLVELAKQVLCVVCRVNQEWGECVADVHASRLGLAAQVLKRPPKVAHLALRHLERCASLAREVDVLLKGLRASIHEGRCRVDAACSEHRVERGVALLLANALERCVQLVDHLDRRLHVALGVANLDAVLLHDAPCLVGRGCESHEHVPERRARHLALKAIVGEEAECARYLVNVPA